MRRYFKKKLSKKIIVLVLVLTILGQWFLFPVKTAEATTFILVWTERQPAGDVTGTWQAVASDSDGSNLIAGILAGRLYISTTNGATWAETQPAGAVDANWYAVASDSDGSNLIAGGVRLYISTTSGSTWTTTSPAGDVTGVWRPASDSDGSNLIAANYGGRLYISTTSGSTWTTTSPAGDVNFNWRAVASDSDGSFLIACILAGRLYISTTSGATWAETQPAGAVSPGWISVASDSDGSNLIAAVSGGRLYISTTSGSTWAETQPAGADQQSWISVASDSDGSNLIAAVNGGLIYTSSDSGATWAETQPAGAGNKVWVSVASDSDGSNLIAGIVAGRLYTGQAAYSTNTVSPNTASAGSTGNTFTFTYTATTTEDSGDMTIAVPLGWSTPQGSSASTVGYTIATSTTGIIGTVENVLDATTNWATTSHITLSANTSDKKEGIASLQANISDSAAAAEYWRYTPAAAQNWGETEDNSSEVNGFFAKSSVNTNTGDFKFLNHDTDGTTVTMSMPNLTANTWTYLVGANAQTIRDNVDWYEFQYYSDIGAVNFQSDSLSAIFDLGVGITNWTASANITVSTTTSGYSTSTSLAATRCTYAAAAGIGASGQCYRTATGGIKFGPGTTTSFWVRSSVALNAGDFQWVDDDSVGLKSITDTVNLPALATSTWTYVTLTTPSNSGLTGKSWGLQQAVDKGALTIDIEAMGKQVDGLDSITGWVLSAGSVQDLSLETTIKKEGTGSLKNTIGATAAAGDKWYDNLASPENWSNYTTVGFWIYSTVATNAGNLQFEYDDTASLASPIATLNIGALATSTWSWQKLTLSGTRSTINSYGIKYATDIGAVSVYIDYMMLGPGVPTFSGTGPWTITTRFLSLATGQTVNIVYGSGGGAGGVTATSTLGVYTFTTQDRASVSDSLLELPVSPTITVSNAAVSAVFSLNMWVRPTNSIASKALAIKNSEIRLFTDTSGKPACAIYSSSAAWQTAATSSSALPLSQWSYVSCVYDRSNIMVYINAVLTATQTMSNVDIAESSNALDLGHDAGSVYGDFQGYTDEFKYYKYARSAAQIKADYTGVATKRGASSRSVTVGEQSDASEGLIGYWKMDEASWATTSATVLDSSGNGYNGTPKNHATSTATAKFGRAGTFDGTDDYVSVGNVGSVQTVEFWLNDINATDGILELTDNIAYISIASNVITASGFTSPTIYVDGQATTAYPTSGWHHIAIVTQTAVSAASTTIGEANNDYLSGQIDDVKIYKTARSAYQIRRDYDSGPGPVAHWKMDENTGQYAYDTSGNANNGTLGSSATADAADPTWTNGKYGNALKFDGADDHAVVSVAPNLTAAQTIEAWVKWSTIGIVYNKSNQSILGRYAVLCDGEVAFAIRDVSLAWNCAGYASSNFQTGQWYHLAGTFDGSSVLKFYVNGVQVDTGSTASVNSSAADAWFGAAMDSTNYSNGSFDDVRIYNYARTPKQIMEDMVGSSRNLVSSGNQVSAAGAWSFDEMQGITAYDKSINQNNLTLSTASWATTTSCKFGGCWQGLGDRWLSRADDDDFDFAATDDFSISLWAKSNATGNPGSNEYLLSKANGTAGYRLYFESSTGYPTFGIDDDNSWTPDASTQATTDFYDNTWHHIVAVKNASTSLEIFVDGFRRNINSSISSIATLANNASLVVGDSDATDNGDEFNGLIDEVQIYRFSLSPLEIKELYNRSASLKLGSAGSLASPGSQTSTDSSWLSYCVPGDTSTCNPPVGQWKMDEKTGANANDTSGNGNTGAFSSSPVWKSAASCHSGSCLDFDGIDDYLNCAAGIADADAYSLSAWIYPHNAANTVAYAGQTIVGRSVGTGNYQLWVGVKSNNIYVDAFNNSATPQHYTTNTSIPTNNKWYHVAVTEISGGAIKIYVNGVLSYSDITDGDDAGGSANFIIGDVRAGFGQYFAGIIDDVRIYNYARTPAQIAYDYNRGAPVAWWKMNDGQNTTTTCDGTTATVSDSSGNSKTGTLFLGGNATSSAWSEAKYSCGLTFDGTNDYVAIGNTSRYDINTLSFWVKPNNTTQKLIELSATNTVEIASGVVTVTGFGTETVYVDGKPTTAFPDTNWHHITIVAGSDTQATDMNLGRNSTTYFAGILDDVRIYNYGLTATQVKTLYNQGSAVRFGPSEGLP